MSVSMSTPLQLPVLNRHASGPTHDAARQRELYKYFTPPDAPVVKNGAIAAASKLSVPDSALTAHVQLAAWRLGAQRAMLSLIDDETQFFVAESTRTLDVRGGAGYEDEGDALWLEIGCTAVPKHGRLCEHTIRQVPAMEGEPAYFEVTDLSADDRFRNLEFVAGGPKFRYYCGIPLRTRKDITIGSLFVLDDKVREPASLAQRVILSAIADNCMSHLEMLREKQERLRAVKMNLCLAAFVNPDQRVSRRRGGDSNRESVESGRSVRSWRRGSLKPVASVEALKRESPRKSANSKSRRSERGPRDEGGSAPGSDSDDTPSGPRVDEEDHFTTYQRAADLLKDSLSLEAGGGVVLMAPSQAYQLDPPDEPSGDETGQRPESGGRRGSVAAGKASSTSSWGVRAQRKSISAQGATADPAEILAKSLSSSNVGQAGAAETECHFTPLPGADIDKLVKRHPRGKLFSFEGGSLISSASSDEDKEAEAAYLMPKSKRVKASKGEASLLTRHFPTARQVMFVPLWDTTTSRWCACFAFSTSMYRCLETAPDFLHAIAFGNCITAEISRLATINADRQKSDFIGSVSHELRSPLHGILASCEFLSETECDSFQKSLVDTADACARTLLDTLNMVLDYSKINHFERNLNKARKSRADASTALIVGQTPGLAPLLNIYGDVDLAVITEEVVEGVASGQMFKDSLHSVDRADLPAMTPSHIGEAAMKPSVEIILDISARDWTFVTQPGAFRRIVMNLFGNALKYTKRGYIRVKLETKETPATLDPEGRKSANASSIVLTVTDSGSGMSPEFMRTKLFTPFSQESALNPGTGLGLSLVRTIVTMLDGDINIQSAQNVGTEVRVTLPMLKSSEPGSAASSTSPSTASSIERAKDSSMAVVRDQSKGRTVAMFHQRPGEQTHGEKHAAQLLHSTIACYLRDWFNFTTVDWVQNAPADVIIIAASDLQALIDQDPSLVGSRPRSMILVLCTTMTRHATKHMIKGTTNVDTLCHPFGPYKLAKALRACMERLNRLVPSTASLASGGADPSSKPVDDVAEAVQHVKLGHPDAATPGVSVMQQGATLASEDSLNAKMALDSLPSKSSSGYSGEQPTEYPFPSSDARDDGTASPSLVPLAPTGNRPHLSERRTISTTLTEMAALDVGHKLTAMTSTGALTDRPDPHALSRTSAATTRLPRLLLVDDNRINLRLLDTFVRKRRYASISLAEDGSQAVAAFVAMLSQDPPAPPDIVFMDLSMPIMDGFEATRRIRAAEAEARAGSDPMQAPPSALIIALTGLASGRDQSEAFTSGFDLYLTKPVSMREVGRLLTNWEANGGVAMAGVPHGAVQAGQEAT